MLNEQTKKPEIIVFAGPNGSGKSTITSLLKPTDIPYINADIIQSAYSCDNLTAAKRAEELRESYLCEHRSFSFETVLSTERNLNLLRRAKEMGYFIRCYYVLTADPQINVARVASRVSAGGHDVPTEKIVLRYQRALALVPELLKVCDICHIYDNSSDKPYRIFKKRKDDYMYCSMQYLWRKDDIEKLTAVSELKYVSLNKQK